MFNNNGPMTFWLALYSLGMDYHSGQWSTGYRLMCYAHKRLRAYHFDELPPLTRDSMLQAVQNTNTYKALLPKAEKLF